MKRIIPLLVAWFMVAAVAAAGEPSSLENARRAQALLGADVWSQVISVENTGSTARYPRTVHALVFELIGILWFYTDVDGTQSFSMHRGRLAQDKADFAPLLHDINPGFKTWTVVPGDAAAGVGDHGPLRNGCFVESVANLRQSLLVGDDVRSPQLLSYYTGGRGRSGHTVLTYKTAKGVTVVDPVDPKRPLVFAEGLAGDAQALGTALLGRVVTRAILVPVGDFAATIAARYVGAPLRGEMAMN
jgi:hypothetical protein